MEHNESSATLPLMTKGSIMLQRWKPVLGIWCVIVIVMILLLLLPLVLPPLPPPPLGLLFVPVIILFLLICQAISSPNLNSTQGQSSFCHQWTMESISLFTMVMFGSKLGLSKEVHHQEFGVMLLIFSMYEFRVLCNAFQKWVVWINGGLILIYIQQIYREWVESISLSLPWKCLAARLVYGKRSITKHR